MNKLFKGIFIGLLLATVNFSTSLCTASTGTMSASEMLDSSYAAMVKGDLHRDSGHRDKALISYKAALTGFNSIAKTNPELDPQIIRFRMAYCENQIETIVSELQPHASKPENTPQRTTLSVPVQTATAKAEVSEERLRNIREQISKRKFPEARESLVAMLKQNPDDSEIRILIAIIQCMMGRFDDANNMMTNLLEEQPVNAHAHVILATAKMGLGDPDSARTLLEQAIKLETNIPEAYYNMTRIMLAGKPDDTAPALEYYQKSLELGGQSDPDLDQLLN